MEADLANVPQATARTAGVVDEVVKASIQRLLEQWTCRYFHRRRAEIMPWKHVNEGIDGVITLLTAQKYVWSLQINNVRWIIQSHIYSLSVIITRRIYQIIKLNLLVIYDS